MSDFDNLLTMSQYNSLSPEEQYEYSIARMHANDEKLRIQRSHAEGEMEGDRKRAWKVAEKLHAQKMPLDFIAEMTELPLEELQQRFS